MNIPRDLDGRRKLSDDDKQTIRIEYAAGGTTYARLADKYGCSKQMILYVVNPDKQQANKDVPRSRRDTAAATAATRRYRAKLKQLKEATEGATVAPRGTDV